MGFLRKAIIIGTGGLAPIKGRSYAERTAKATEKQLRLQKQMLRASQPVAAVPKRLQTQMLPSQRESRRRAMSAKAVTATGDELEQWAASWTAPASGEPGDVLLTAAGAKQIQVIKVVRAVTGLGLKEAMALVDQVPSVIMKGLPATEAEELKARLEAVGATAELAGAPAVETMPMSGVVGGLADELARLADLHQRGALTDEEFAAAKAKLLD